jgi:hypothetical protein
MLIFIHHTKGSLNIERTYTYVLPEWDGFELDFDYVEF